MLLLSYGRQFSSINNEAGCFFETEGALTVLMFLPTCYPTGLLFKALEDEKVTNLNAM